MLNIIIGIFVGIVLTFIGAIVLEEISDLDWVRKLDRKRERKMQLEILKQRRKNMGR